MPRWIWEHPDWTEQFRWDEARCLTALAEVRRAQGALLGRVSALGLGLDVRATTLEQDAITTSAVEGEALAPASVRSSVARRLGLPDVAGAPSDSRVDGLLDMLEDATTRAREPLTAERLWGWQAALFPTGRSGIRRISVGVWRCGDEPMRVLSGSDGQTLHFEAPPSARVPAEMDRFLAWWAAGGPPTDGLLRAALAHLWLLTIHPFDDGNGRVSRAVADLALTLDDGAPGRAYSLSAQIVAERSTYYAELEAAQRGDGEITSWMLWFLGCTHRAITRAERTLDGVFARARLWQRLGQTPLNERQLKAVRRMAESGPGGFEGGMTNRKYSALTRASRATAQRDLAELVALGVLEPIGAGRSAAYGLRWPATTG